jgi:peptide-methionine (S)-S-oxide reductase
MSWRLLAAAGALLVFLGIPGLAQAQESASPPKSKAESTTAGSVDGSGSASQDAAATAKPTEKPTAAKAKTAAAKAKAKTKKSSARTNSRASSGSDPGAEPKYELATFGAGCFWHVEADFERLNGVISAVSGYAGGQTRNPNYEMVHEGMTGHAEVVMVQYDPEIISYEDLLKVFWQCHDPTTPNRQGPDVGTQYRSIILFHNEAQKKAALKSYQKLVDAQAFRNPIVTQLYPLRAFYRAEDEHQDYYGGKPRVSSSKRRTASSAKSSKKPLSRVAKALATEPADEAKPADQAKPAGEQAAGSDPATAKDAETKP